MIAVPFRNFKKATLVTLQEGGSSYFETKEENTLHWAQHIFDSGCEFKRNRCCGGRVITGFVVSYLARSGSIGE